MREKEYKERKKPGEKYMPSRNQGHARRKKGNASSSSSNVLSGCKLTLDVQESNHDRLSSFSKTQSHLTHVNDTISIFNEIVPAKFRGKNLILNTGKTILDWKPDSELICNEGMLTFQEGTEIKQVKAYQKTIALLDPYHCMRYDEYPTQPFMWNLQTSSVLAPENQGYIDTIASALVSKLHTQYSSPHFCEFYGEFRAVSETYYYNLEDDLENFRFTSWFWKSIETGNFSIRMMNKKTGQKLTMDEIKYILKPDDEFLSDDSSDDDDDDNDGDDDDDGDNDDDDDDDDDISMSESSTPLEAEVLDDDTIMQIDTTLPIEMLEETINIGIENDSTVHLFERVRSNGKPRSATSSMSSHTDTSNISFTEEYTIHAEFKNMPVVILYLEKLSGTMDSLLEQSDFAPVCTAELETQWSAWLFQICAALSQLQNILRLTHNDLHTNNIMWKSTEMEYLWYKDSKERTWRIPTYGRIFTIIDYGRAIFTLNGHTCISSDYDDGHDASGMYNFGPIEDTTSPRVLPNKSFDLCRLSCSLLRGLYPRNPDSLPKGQVLTKDGLWEVRETKHPLFNILWSWLRTKDGKNVLETQTGKEQFPGFELYSVIAAQVKNAIPDEQFGKSVFQQFIWSKEIPVTTVKCIPI